MPPSAREAPRGATALLCDLALTSHPDGARHLQDQGFPLTIDRRPGHLAVPFTNYEAERAIRPIKVQQRTCGGAWRTLQRLTDFAIVQSYLDTATKWGITKLHALHQLFTTGLWLPPALIPAEQDHTKINYS